MYTTKPTKIGKTNTTDSKLSTHMEKALCMMTDKPVVMEDEWDNTTSESFDKVLSQTLVSYQHQTTRHSDQCENKYKVEEDQVPKTTLDTRKKTKDVNLTKNITKDVNLTEDDTKDVDSTNKPHDSTEVSVSFGDKDSSDKGDFNNRRARVLAGIHFYNQQKSAVQQMRASKSQILTENFGCSRCDIWGVKALISAKISNFLDMKKDLTFVVDSTSSGGTWCLDRDFRSLVDYFPSCLSSCIKDTERLSMRLARLG